MFVTAPTAHTHSLAQAAARFGTSHVSPDRPKPLPGPTKSLFAGRKDAPQAGYGPDEAFSANAKSWLA